MSAMSPFEAALRRLIGIEGDFSDDDADSGGATRFGVTEMQARAYGYTGEMRQLPVDLAQRIYRVQYWDLLHLDEVAGVSPALAHELFDTAVNLGQAQAARMLQRALNLFNRSQTLYADMRVDGVVGQVTLAALRSYLANRGHMAEAVLLRALNAQQGAFYLDLAERREKDERFVFGWFANRVEIPS